MILNQQNYSIGTNNLYLTIIYKPTYIIVFKIKTHKNMYTIYIILCIILCWKLNVLKTKYRCNRSLRKYLHIYTIINVCINKSWVGLFRKKVQYFKCVHRGIVIIWRQRPIVASSHYYIIVGFGCLRVREIDDYYHIRCR